MADASITLGLDASELRKELQQVPSAVGAAGNAAAQNFNRATEASDNLLRSNHRVATQIGHLAKDLSSGAGGAQVLAVAFEGVERSLNLPLGALAGLAATGYIVEGIGKAVAEYKKLNDEVDKLAQARPNPQYETLEQIRSQAAETEKVLKTLRDQQGNEGITKGGLLRDLIAAGTIGGTKGLTEGLPALIHEVREKRRGQISTLEGSSAEDKTAEIEKLQEKTAVAEARLKGNKYTADRAETSAKFDEQLSDVTGRLGQRGVVELEKQKQIALAEIDKKEQEEKDKDAEEKKKEAEKKQQEADAQKRREAEDNLRKQRTDFQQQREQERIDDLGGFKGVSLGDLARHNVGQARVAAREEQLAHQAALRGDLSGAESHAAHAEQLKRSLGGLLAENRQREAMQKALDESKLLHAIEENTRGIGRNK